MKRILNTAIVLAALASSGALAQSRARVAAPNRSGSLPPEPQARADGYRLTGRCDVAIPIYRALAVQGAGYELAAFDLGLCLLEGAKTAPDAAALQQEAAGLMLTAANTGLPNAQNGLAALYLDGTGVVRDPVEAGKWALLYHSSSVRRMYRLPDIAPALQARLDAALDEKAWDQAQARADAWSPVTQGGNR